MRFEVDADLQIRRRERLLQPPQERNELRVILRLEILEIDIDALEVIRQTPVPQVVDEPQLQRNLVQESMHALRIELALLRVAEDRHDVHVVRARDLEHFKVVRRLHRIPVVQIKTGGVLLEMNPRRQHVRHA